MYSLFARTNDGSVLRDGAIGNSNFIQAMKPAWESANPDQLRRLPWNIRLFNISSGYIDRNGHPVSAFFYELALPPGVSFQDMLNEPTFGQVAPRVRNLLGLLVMKDKEVYGPEYYFTSTVQGRPSTSEIQDQLTKAWTQAYEEKREFPAVEVFLVTTRNSVTNEGFPGTRLMYFLSVGNQIMRPPLSLLTRVNDILLRQPDKVRTQVDTNDVLAIPGTLIRSQVDQTAIEDALKNAWQEVNAGKF